MGKLDIEVFECDHCQKREFGDSRAMFRLVGNISVVGGGGILGNNIVDGVDATTGYKPKGRCVAASGDGTLAVHEEYLCRSCFISKLTELPEEEIDPDEDPFED